MRVLVPVKRVIDYTVKVRVRKDLLGVEKKTAKMSLNPFCEIAVEECVRLKERGHAVEVIAVSIGGKKCGDQLRTAMAMGCDRSIHVTTDEALETDIGLQPLSVSRILAALVAKESPDLVLMGKQSIDGDNCAVAPMLAGRLGWPQATFASAIECLSSGELEVTREVDGGSQRLRVRLPAVVSADLRLNEPRFATLQNIMKAKKKPVEEIALDSLEGGAIAEAIARDSAQTRYTQVTAPSQREAGVMVASIEELFEKLKAAQLI